MKKSHKWDVEEIEILDAKCPHCRKWLHIESYDFGIFEKEDIITCTNCGRVFELGRQK